MPKIERSIVRRALGYAAIAVGLTVAGLILAILSLKWYLSSNQALIVERIRERTGVQIEVGTFEVDWRLHRPRIRLLNTKIQAGAFSSRAAMVQLTFRVRESLKQRDLRLREVEVDGLAMELPGVLDQPRGSLAQAKLPISEIIQSWQRFSEIVDAVVLQDAKMTMQASADRLVTFDLATLRVTGTKTAGDIQLAAKVNAAGSFEFAGNWNVSGLTELRVDGRMAATELPIPLLHVQREDFAIVRASLRNSGCNDYGSIPCMRLQSAEGQVDLAVSDERFLFDLAQLNAKTDEMQTQGEVKIEAVQSDVLFDINLKESSGTIHAVLGILDSAWMGQETYRWLLQHIPGAVAEHGMVSIKGRSGSGDFEDFAIAFNAKTPRLEFDKGWPALSDVDVGVIINADSINVGVNGAKFGSVPLRSGKFFIPSFSQKNILGKVEAVAGGTVQEWMRLLQATPIHDVETKIRKMAAISSDQLASVEVRLTLNFSEFADAGIEYVVKVAGKGVSASILDRMIGLDRSRLSLHIEGQAAESLSRTRIRGSVVGQSSGKWQLSSPVRVKFSMDTDAPMLGLRVAIASTRPELPKASGVRIDLPDVNGTVEMQKSGGRQLVTARFKRLFIPDLSQLKDEAKPSPSPTDSTKLGADKDTIDPREFPALDFECRDFRYADLELGQVRFSAKKKDNGLQEIVGTLRSQRLNIELDDGEWANSEGATTSFFRGRVVASDTGAVLKKIGVFDGLANGRSILDFDLRWPGAPWQMRPSLAGGFLIFKLNGGELLSVDSVFVKLIDVLTLKSLKFYEKGSKIERAQGKLRLENGILLMDLVDVELSSTDIKLKGDIDLVNEKVATDVGMEVKIGSAVSIGAMGVVAGPAVAILGYLVSDDLQLPGFDLLNKLTTFSYRLEGPWSEPKVKAFRPKPFGF